MFNFQRIEKIANREDEFSLAKLPNQVQLSDDTKLIQKRLYEESFSENLLKLQVRIYFPIYIVVFSQSKKVLIAFCILLSLTKVAKAFMSILSEGEHYFA